MDNGSADGSWEWITREMAGVARMARRPGVTIATLRNEGARLARGELLAFIDADCVIPEDYAERAIRVLGATGAAGTGCRYQLPPNPHWVEHTWHELHDKPREGPVNYINSGNLCIWREAFDAVGGFDETLVTGEDAELGQRLARAGRALHEASVVSAIHLGNPKSLGQFFRKQRWHALGMFGTVDLRSIDRPTAGTILQLIGLLAGLAILFVSAFPWWWRTVAALAMVLGAPVLTVLYRLSGGGRTRSLPRAVTLYLVYYLARLAALLDIVRGKARVR